MSAHAIQQQINLYQPVVVHGSRLLKASTVSIALAAIMVVLIATYSYGLHAVNKLAQHVDETRAQQEKQTALLTLNAANATPKQLPQLQAQLKTLNTTLADHRRALQLLRVGAAGGDSGFSERLVALANQHLDGMWLNHIALGSDNGVESLGGGAINAELIPRYISNLAAEPALRGTRINQFEIERKNAEDAVHASASTIEFHATRIIATPAQPDNAADAQPSTTQNDADSNSSSDNAGDTATDAGGAPANASGSTDQDGQS